MVSDAARREHLVAVGRALFLDLGYGRTTMDQVAARGRVSKQTLYRFFANKAALFEAVVAAHRYAMLALPGDYDHLSAADALATIFRADIGEAEERERMAFIIVAVQEMPLYPELGEALRVHGAEVGRRALADWLVHATARGLLGPIEDAEAHAGILMDMVFGVPGFRHSCTAAWPSAQERSVHVRRCISLFLNGVGRGAQSPSQSG